MPKPDDINSYNDLMKLTVPRLRELASADTELANTTALDKDALADALADAYGLEKPKQVRAAGIKLLKKQMKGVKEQRDRILAAAPADRDRDQLLKVRKEIKLLKRQMRKLAS